MTFSAIRPFSDPFCRTQTRTTPNDYRVLVSVGPFSGLMPDASIQLDLAFVGGEGLAGLLDNAAMAKLVYRGMWYDVDKNGANGHQGQGELISVTSHGLELGSIPTHAMAYDESVKLPKGRHALDERRLHGRAGALGLSRLLQGEHGVHEFSNRHQRRERRRLTGLRAPCRRRRPCAPSRATAASALIWDNLSEIARDAMTQKIDFEGYQVWRADEWHRPLGTTIASGPSRSSCGTCSTAAIS